MKQPTLMRLGMGAAMLLAVTPAHSAGPGLAGEGDRSLPARVVSTTPPLRWQDAMISGNGSTGIMVMVPPEQTTNVVPNATCEIAICRQVLTNLIAGCRELGVWQESLPRWQQTLAKLPNYVINADGALAEWTYPGLGDNYNHRHSSHLYPNHWNNTLGTVSVTLRSDKAQSVKLRFGIDLRFVSAADAAARGLVTAGQTGDWRIQLPAGKQVRLDCRY